MDVDTASGAGSSEAVSLLPAADVEEVEAAGLASWRRGVLPAAEVESLLVGSGATLSSESEVLSVWVPRPERRAGSLGSADDAVEAGESEVAEESEASVESVESVESEVSEEFEEAEESEEFEVVELWEPVVSANAIGSAAMPEPTPSATASAPTRPT
ncbi:hypothetical protein [Mycolicibacterium sp. CR10]|uniref:hypothetical protein n=1 Tax=Mycolicibacterium sp. CR10 TaxID=2562314 RepID=UPI0014859236|nr:hypothetical protein [Mycolicibacterium sp. CR10]